MVVMDMPAVKFDKRKAYATATCIAEKAPIMVAKIFGEVNGYAYQCPGDGFFSRH